MFFLGIDCGTQGLKAVIWNASTNEILSSAYHSYEMLSSRPGQKEQDPLDWINALKVVTAQCLSKAAISGNEIKGVGISGQQHGLVLLDEKNNILRPAKLWCDTEATSLLNDFLSDFKKETSFSINQITGIHVPVAFTLAKLLWVKEMESDIFYQINKILLPHEYINFWLTGEYCSEYGDASGTGYFDTFKRCWSKTVTDKIDPDLYSKLPPVIQSHEPSGYLSKTSAHLLGLKYGIPVSSGGGDNMMSAIGTGNINSGVLTMSLGTSGTLFTHTPQQIDTSQEPDINAFCSSSNGWLPLVSTMNVTNAVNSFREVLNISISEFDGLLQASRPGANGVICYPWFNGSRLPNIPTATAGLQGITANNFTRENLLRSVVEGVTYKLCKGIDIFNKKGLSFNQIRVIGGGANSAVWCQMIADISGIEVIRLPVSDAAALGAALQSYWCVESLRSSQCKVLLSELIPEGLLNPEGYGIVPIFQEYSTYRDLYADYHCRLEEYQLQF